MHWSLGWRLGVLGLQLNSCDSTCDGGWQIRPWSVEGRRISAFLIRYCLPPSPLELSSHLLALFSCSMPPSSFHVFRCRAVRGPDQLFGSKSTLLYTFYLPIHKPGWSEMDSEALRACFCAGADQTREDWPIIHDNFAVFFLQYIPHLLLASVLDPCAH